MAVSLVLERRLPMAAAPVGAQRRRVYIFLTRPGAAFTVLLATMLLGAVNYTNSMAYLMTFLLASLFMVSMLHTYRGLRALVVTLHDAEPVFAGDSGRFPLVFDNRGGYERCAIVVRPASRKGDALALQLNLPADGISNTAIELPLLRRGRRRLERLVIESRYPLGLFRAWSYLDTGPVCTVYPRPGGSFRLPPGCETRLEQVSGRHAGTDDFAGFAPYRPGDSTRRIDWKAHARGHDLMVKRFTGAGSRQLVLQWSDTPANMDTELRLSQLCRWVLEADRLGHEYGLIIPGHSIAPERGDLHRRECLEALAGFGDAAGDH